MRKTLRSMAMVMALTMAVTGISLNTNVVEIKAASKVSYTLKKGVLTIKGKGEMPNKMKFKNNKKIKKVIIKKGVTSISKKAFEGCTKLKEVKIANTVKYIGKSAFANTGLESVNIPKSVDTMGVNVFDSCDKLKSITMPGDVKVYQAKTFDRTLNPDTDVDTVKFTTELNLDNITYLYADKFDVYENDENYKDIDGVIYTKDGKELVRVPSGCDELVVDKDCEVFCTNAIEYSLRGSDGEPISMCLDINKIVLPINVKEIDVTKHYRISSGSPYLYVGEWVIENKNIDGLRDLAFSLSEISGTNLERVYIDKFSDFLSIKDGMYIIDDCVLIGFTKDKFNEENIVIPEGIKEISGEIFWDFKNPVKSITLPEGLEKIGDGAFKGANITEIKLPSTVKEIGSAFEYCTNLNKVELNEGLERIEGTFRGCTSLKEVIIPSTVKSIGSHTFYYTKLDKFDIPNSVTTIGSYAFAGCDIKELKIPDSVTTIGTEAFNACKIKEIEIPDSVTTIESGAFSCSNLEKIKLPSGLKKLDVSVLADTKITSVVIPESVEEIDNGAFEYCHNLKEIVIPENVKRIGAGAFQNCENLEEIVIPNNITIIGEWAFNNCENLKNITIGKNVEEIGLMAFENTGWSELVVPKSVKVIDSYAFSNCKNAKKLIIKNKNAKIAKDAFFGNSKLIVKSKSSPKGYITSCNSKYNKSNKNSSTYTLIWNKNYGVDKYQIEIITHKKSSDITTKNMLDKNSCKIAVKEGEQKVVRIRTCKKVKGKTIYGVWSNKIELTN